MMLTMKEMFSVIYYNKFNTDLMIDNNNHAIYPYQMNSLCYYYNQKIIKREYINDKNCFYRSVSISLKSI